MLKTRLLKKAVMEISGDMETDKDMMDLIRLIKKQVKNGFTIMLVINESLHDFHVRLGKVSTTEVHFQDVTNEDDPNFFELIGKMALDTYIPEDYFIKCEFDKVIYKIKGVVEEC